MLSAAIKNCNIGHRFKSYYTHSIYKVVVHFFWFAWALCRVAYFQQVCCLELHDMYSYHSQTVFILTLYCANTALLATACLAVFRPRNHLWCCIFLQKQNFLGPYYVYPFFFLQAFTKCWTCIFTNVRQLIYSLNRQTSHCDLFEKKVVYRNLRISKSCFWLEKKNPERFT